MLLLLSGCNLHRQVRKEKGDLLVKVDIKGVKEPEKELLYGFAKQKPNRKVLWVFPYNMWLYYRAQRLGYFEVRQKNIKDLTEKTRIAKEDLSNSIEESDIDAVIKEKRKKVDKYEKRLASAQKKYQSFLEGIEPPVLYDSFMTELSKTQMSRYCFDIGYFNNEISTKATTKNRKVKLQYIFNLNEKHHIRNIKYIIADKRIDSLLIFDTSISLIKHNSPYNVNVLNAERQRIENVLQNNGYFNFRQNSVKYKVITEGMSGDSLDLIIRIENPSETSYHKKYIIGSVQVVSTKNGNSDTPVIHQGIEYAIKSSLFKPESISDFIFIRPNNEYKKVDKRNTESRLSQLRFVQFADITYLEDTLVTLDKLGKLNVIIDLTTRNQYKFKTELEVNRTEEVDRQITNYLNNYYGLAGSAYLINRNLNKSALHYESTLRGSVELHFDSLKLNETFQNKSNYQIGLIQSLVFPQIMLPWQFLKKILPDRFYLPEDVRKLSSQTSINLNFLFENNVFFERTTGTLNYTYLWLKGKNRFFYTPLEINLISATPSNNFKIPDDPLIRNLFDRHIITDGRFTWMVNQQPITTVIFPEYFVRNSIEIGGFLPSMYDNIFERFSRNQLENEKMIFGNRYFNYVKLESDYRYYIPLAKKTNLAMRISSGFGFPFWNSSILPYERRFYVGGANSLRGWRSRDLGPGTFTPIAGESTDKSGDFKIEGSLELRFPFYSFINGAIFTDFGNVWVSKRDLLRPGARFSNEFYKEIALSPGLGLRFDFSFFVIRFDAGWKLYDPQFSTEDRWIFNRENAQLKISNGNLNIGIGYPF